MEGVTDQMLRLTIIEWSSEVTRVTNRFCQQLAIKRDRDVNILSMRSSLFGASADIVT